MEFAFQQRIGSFELAAHLASGGMADVYLAGNPDSSRLAVIKILRKNLLDNPEVIRMFGDEARLMQVLNHANVVKVLEHGRVGDRPFITMEYLPGDHLGVVIRLTARKQQQLSPSLVARICLQAANGLDYLHTATDARGRSLRLVHRDISPSNILMTYDGRVKILDLGIAISSKRTVHTVDDSLKGKIPYMSPEQIEHEPLDGRSDIFSLGIVMWELLTGEHLFGDGSEFQIMKRICEVPAVSPAFLRPDLPESLMDITMRCLERNPDARFPNAADLRSALSGFLLEPGNRGHPEEIARTAHELLSERKKRKKKAIDSLQITQELQDYLFGEANGADGSDAFTPRDDSLPDVVIYTEEEPEEEEEITQVEGQQPAELKTARQTDYRPAMALGLIVLGVGLLTLWLLWPQAPGPAPDEPDRPPFNVKQSGFDPGGPINDGDHVAKPEPTAPDEPTDQGTDTAPQEDEKPVDEKPVDEKPVDDVPDDAEPDPPGYETPGADAGFLRISTNVQVDVYVNDRLIGTTPVTDMRLAPGEYQITLENQEENISKKFSVKIQTNEVASRQFIF